MPPHVDELEWTGKALLQHKEYCTPQSIICFVIDSVLIRISTPGLMEREELLFLNRCDTFLKTGTAFAKQLTQIPTTGFIDLVLGFISVKCTSTYKILQNIPQKLDFAPISNCFCFFFHCTEANFYLIVQLRL